MPQQFPQELLRLTEPCASHSPARSHRSRLPRRTEKPMAGAGPDARSTLLTSCHAQLYWLIPVENRPLGRHSLPTRVRRGGQSSRRCLPRRRQSCAPSSLSGKAEENQPWGCEGTLRRLLRLRDRRSSLGLTTVPHAVLKFDLPIPDRRGSHITVAFQAEHVQRLELGTAFAG